MLIEKDYVCALNFDANSILKYEEFNIRRFVEKLKRTTPILKSEAVHPTIFPSLQKYLLKTIKKRLHLSQV